MDIKRIIKEEIDIFLNEELLGSYEGRWYKRKPIEVYSNPKSIKKMNSYIRGIIDREGNFYVADIETRGSGQGGITTHSEIAKFLSSKGLLPNEEITSDGVLNYLKVHRYDDTNDFYFGETSTYDPLFAEENFFKKAKQKNPTINFIPRGIWG